MIRGFRFDLHPTAAQAETLDQWVGVTRLVYNLALEQRRDFGRRFRERTGRVLNWAAQSKQVTDLRAEFPFIAAVPRSGQEQALRDLDRAFSAFFAGRSGFPTPRRKGVHDSIRLQREGRLRVLNGKWAVLRLPSIGDVKLRLTRGVPPDVRNITLAKRAGRWVATFVVEVSGSTVRASEAQVGIDRGVANTVSLSDGRHIRLPDMTANERRLRKAQRKLARRKRGSTRYAKQRARVAALSAKAARIRHHHLHVASRQIADRYGVVALEDLNVAAMTKRGRGKHGLNRSILAQGWTLFASMLDYKLEAAGGRLIYVPAAFTSQTCSACGVVDRASRKSQAVFACVHCGHQAHADTNAALEIRRRSTALLPVEGGHSGRPIEAGTWVA